MNQVGNAFAQKIDAHVGTRINKLRVSMGMSLKKVAKAIGVTHQQLQKYEKGINRISAGRLATIACFFKEPISYFFEGSSEDSGSSTQEIPHTLSQHQRMCVEVYQNFLRIKNPRHQNAVNFMTRTLADDD